MKGKAEELNEKERFIKEKSQAPFQTPKKKEKKKKRRLSPEIKALKLVMISYSRFKKVF